MSVLLGIGLLIQAAALVIVFGTFGRRAFTLIGPAFVVMAVLFHGVTEVIQLLGLAPNPYRALVTQGTIDEWVTLVSPAILLLAISYGLTATIPRERPEPNADAKALPWQVLMVIAVPIYITALAGRGTSADNYWLGGLSSQFLTIAFVFASFDFIRRRNGRYLVPILLAQSALLAPVGSRWSVVAAALLTVWGLAYVGLPPTRKQGLTVLAAALLATVVISSARAVSETNSASHFTAASGTLPSERAQLLVDGIKGLPTSWTTEAFWRDWVYRVDGNSFPALVRSSANDTNQHPLGAGRLLDVGLIAIPRVLYPDKPIYDQGALNEKKAVLDHYALPYRVDFLSPTLGMLYAYLGPIGLYVAAILLGIAFAPLDGWLTQRVTSGRLMIGMGVLLCVLLYEQGMRVYPLTLRGVLTLLVIAKLAEIMWSSTRRPAPGVRRPARSASARGRAPQGLPRPRSTER